MAGFIVGLAYAGFIWLAMSICRAAGQYDQSLEEDIEMNQSFMGKEKAVFETGWTSATAAIANYIADHFGDNEADGTRMALDVVEWAERELRGR